MKLTKTSISKILKPSEGYDLYWDDEVPGLGLRVLSSGTMTYILNYRTKDGKQRRYSIGRHGVLAPVTARKKARKLLNALVDGNDPLSDRETRKDEITFAVLAEKYIQRHAKQLKTGCEEERRIRKDLLPAWKNLRADDIKRKHVLDLVHKIKDRGSPVMANRVLALIKRIYNFGIDNGLIEATPAFRIKPVARENERQRILTEDEIPIFWHETDEMHWTNNFTQAALRMTLVTAQRPGEITSMEWDEISEDWWIIPEHKSKNGNKHRVPLSPLAHKILKELPRPGQFVFPSMRGNQINQDDHMKRMALSRAVHRNRETSELDTWTPHDLRRTAATHLGRIGFGQYIWAILNHTPQGITKRVYDLYTYDKEKQTALNSWGMELERIIFGRKATIRKLVR